MAKYILSTMANAVNYTFYGKVPSGTLPPVAKRIKIEGGAGLPSINTGFGNMAKDDQGVPLWTPDGVVTPISDENFDRLKDHVIFKKHMDAGLIRVIDHDITKNHGAVEKLVRSMEKDDFSPLNKDKANTKIKVKTALEENGDENRM